MIAIRTLTPRTTNVRLAVLALALLAAVVAYLILHITRDGIGYSPDSRSYLVAAQYVAKGKGVKVYNGNGKPALFTHLAPLLSIVTGAIAALGPTPQAIDRWLNVACVVTSVGLAGWLCWRLSGKSVAATVVGPLLLFLDVPLVQLHIILLSEPMFLTLVLAALVLLDAALRTKRLALVAVCGAVAGTAALTRYAGVSVLGVMTVAVFFAWPGKWSRKLIAAALLGGIAVVPPAAWLIYGYRHTGKIGNRDRAWHPPTPAQWKQMFATLSNWVFPAHGQNWAFWIGVVGFVAMLVLAGVLEFNRAAQTDDAATRTRRTAWAVALGYLCFIIVSVTLFDAYTPLDDRILSPMRSALMPVCVSLFLGALSRLWGRGAFAVVLAGFVGVIVAQTVHLAQWQRTARDQALGFNSTVWRTSKTLAYVSTVPATSVIYTNMADVIFLRCNRFSKPVPQMQTTSSHTTQYRAYYRGLPHLWQDLKDHDGLVIYSKKIHRSTLVPAAKLAEDIGLVVVVDTKEATVYKLGPTSTRPPANLGPGLGDPMHPTKPLAPTMQQADHDAAVRRKRKRAGATRPTAHAHASDASATVYENTVAPTGAGVFAGVGFAPAAVTVSWMNCSFVATAGDSTNG